ncbi:outer membrane protein assembly factor BamB family protein [Natronorubrum sp. FCH18a]|uniref:outer membrane protein assembly factor BamB family protein n=1 Tax=Natronorubrum sp. FCH18a TaxID=3447018 RepID=UPI003F5150D6
MVEYDRRRVLQYTGLAIAGGALTTGVAAAQDDESAPVGEADGWSSLGGNPGNNPVASSGPEPPVTVAWEYDRGGPAAVADGTVYLTTGGEVHALDADDGTLAWQTHDIGAIGTPAVTDEAVYVGGERLTRIELDGEICCQADLGYDEAIPSPVVAEGLVFTVAGGVLYAVDAREYEIRWQFDPADGTLYEQPVAVGDGAVFAVSESRLFARELEDGTERWTDDDPTGDDEYSHFTAPNDRQVSHPVATDDVVAVGSVDSEPGAVWESGYTTLYDAETGVKRTRSEPAPVTPGSITDERFFARTMHDLRGFDRETGERDWETEYNMYHVSSAVVSDKLVYAGVTVNGEAYAEEMPEPATGVYAFDENGETEWAIETDERPTLAMADGTLYASGETLIAIRSETDGSEDGSDDDGDEDPADDGESGDDGGESGDGGGESGDDGETGGDESPDGADGNGGDGGNETDGSDDGSGADGSDGGNGTDDPSEGSADGPEDAADGPNGEPDGDEGDDGEDGTPGFTAGAGIAGGALTLEWLRRRGGDEDA